LAFDTISVYVLNRGDAYKRRANEFYTVSNCCATGKL